MQSPETRDLKTGYAPVSIQPPYSYNPDYTVPPPPPPPPPPMYGAVVLNPFVGYTDTRRRARCRFWHALLAAVLVWIFASLAFRTLSDLRIINRNHLNGVSICLY